MIAGCDNDIKVFEFKLGRLQQISILSEHTDDVQTLYFMKKSNKFISGSKDNTIRIWGMNKSEHWHCKQLLKEGHSERVNGVIMNKAENQILSFSCDNSIIFWVKNDYWEQSQTLTDNQKTILCISLNEKNQLVSCSTNLIHIRQFDYEKWRLMQKIKLGYGLYVCFVGEDLFILQRVNQLKMEIFKQSEQTQLYIKHKDVQVDKLNTNNLYFPLGFNKQKLILLKKTVRVVYIMKKQINDDFIIQQTLQFTSYNVYGAMTDDGDYLVTWDYDTEQYQVRKQQN